MLKLLLKKQLTEIFRGHFYDAKQNRARSKAGVIGRFVGYFIVMGGILGGVFTALSLFLCGPLIAAGAGWLYYVILGMIAILLGMFGSVFSTYATLYLAHDNDLLLAMPVPVRYILVSRLLSVYLMGLLYSGTVMVPAFLVSAGHGMGAAGAVGGFLLWILISLFVLVLSCLLGFVVAKASLKLKNRSITRVLIALVIFGAYYVIYFRAQVMMREFIARVSEQGVAVEGPVRILYVFGRAGEGSPAALLICAAVVIVLLLLTMHVLSRTFVSIATATGKTERAVYREKKAEQRSVPHALFTRELARFTGSSNYMLNCGLGMVLLIVFGVLLIIKGNAIVSGMGSVFGAPSGGMGAPGPGGIDPGVGFAVVLLCAAVCLISAVNDISAPSVSLEGKHLWILKSLPVSPMQVLAAKLKLHVILSGVPALFCAVCAVAVLRPAPAAGVLFVAVCVLNVILQALWGLYLGVKRPNLYWTSEVVVVKQSLTVFLAMLGGWICAIVLGLGYLLLGGLLGLTGYLAVAAVIAAVLSWLLFRWLKTRGAELFREL